MGLKITEVKVKGILEDKKELTINYQESEIKVPLSEVTKDLRISLAPVYRKKLQQIEAELGLSTREALIALIDLYFLETSSSVKILNKNILKRLSKGVNKSFLIQLKLLYTLLGHFLKKIRYIK